MQGLHLTADLYQCACPSQLLTDADALADFCRQQTLDAGLTIVGEEWQAFPEFEGQPGGVTGMLLLAESHLAIHTWPERNGVTLDVYVCNFMQDNSGKAQSLIDGLEAVFKPGQSQRNRIWRGDADGPATNGELITENLNDQALYGFRFTERLLERQTAFQRLELLSSESLGTTLRLDGCLMTSEVDEFFYHEGLIHPAAMAHPAPRRALIVGGGDGGALEELLKHNCVDHVTLVDLDAEVIEVAREHLQSIHKGAFDDPRADIRVGDGADFLARTADRFDLIYLDLTDPETPAGPLYTTDFFQSCQRVLAPGGALVLHLGSPFHEAQQVQALGAELAQVFEQVHGYGLHIPLYGSYWGMVVASDELDPTALSAQDIQQRLEQRFSADQQESLQFYNAALHGALFALPTFYRRLLPAQQSCLEALC
ncbi:polyamine aminopropyltransferase [Alcaligenes sp. SDU_A2]|uniref:polyamine aminopropyltransferase n=1 Tax=Alcaligenes sp. SDU_A2 TaxID=3136634 RepID=UPI00311D9ECB